MIILRIHTLGNRAKNYEVVTRLILQMDYKFLYDSLSRPTPSNSNYISVSGDKVWYETEERKYPSVIREEDKIVNMSSDFFVNAVSKEMLWGILTGNEDQNKDPYSLAEI